MIADTIAAAVGGIGSSVGGSGGGGECGDGIGCLEGGRGTAPIVQARSIDIGAGAAGSLGGWTAAIITAAWDEYSPSANSQPTTTTTMMTVTTSTTIHWRLLQLRTTTFHGHSIAILDGRAPGVPSPSSTAAGIQRS